MSEFLGVDLSRFNMISNYDLICKEYDFVILRAGGSDDGNPPVNFYRDKFFEDRYVEFSKRGMNIGAYWVVSPLSTSKKTSCSARTVFFPRSNAPFSRFSRITKRFSRFRTLI